MTDQETKGKFWESFVSLDWYDSAIEFLFRFVAKTSEPLLAAGIVYSAADVLSKGHLGSSNPTMDNLWAISQALAIESSGGVVLVYGLQSLKEKDHVKAWLYFILSTLLASTGGIMLFMQLAGWENQQPDSGFMLFLFCLRCVVSVGYIYLCRTKSISFRNLDKATAPALPSTPVQEPAPASIDYQKLAQELAPLLQAVRTTIIEEVKASITGPEVRVVPGISERKGSQKQPPLLSGAERQQGRVKRAEEPSLPIEEQLEAVYQELAQTYQGQYISGRSLAKLTHIDRQICTTWLKKAHPENTPGTPASQPEMKLTGATDQPNMPARASHLEEKVTATQLRPAGAAIESLPPARDTESEIWPNPEAVPTTSQPEATATDPQSELAATITSQPRLDAVAMLPEPLAMSNHLQASSDTTQSQPEIETVTTRLEASEPRAPASGINVPAAATETSPASQPAVKQPSTEEFIISHSELEAATAQPQPEVASIVSRPGADETTATLQPGKKARASATQKTRSSPMRNKTGKKESASEASNSRSDV